MKNLEYITPLLKPFLKTNEVVAYLNDKKYHRHALYRDELKEQLGAKRIGKGRNLVFETIKVLQFKISSD